MASEHTPDLHLPWKVITGSESNWEMQHPPYVEGIQDADGNWVVRFDDDYGTNQATNARHIVACVNACVGLPTELLEKAGLEFTLETMKAFREGIAALESGDYITLDQLRKEATDGE